MRCFYVLVHGKLDWEANFSQSRDLQVSRPAGFYCHRFVLADNDAAAADKALRRIRANLNKQTKWLTEGVASLKMEATEVSSAPLHKLLRPDNKGHTFYERE